MYVGIHGLVYGLPTILDAAAILEADPASSHVRFVLVGDGPEKQALVDRARREGLKNIEFKDSVPKEQGLRHHAGGGCLPDAVEEEPGACIWNQSEQDPGLHVGSETDHLLGGYFCERS